MRRYDYQLTVNYVYPDGQDGIIASRHPTQKAAQDQLAAYDRWLAAHNRTRIGFEILAVEHKETK
jgi:hypothetical protein